MWVCPDHDLVAILELGRALLLAVDPDPIGALEILDRIGAVLPEDHRVLAAHTLVLEAEVVRGGAADQGLG